MNSDIRWIVSEFEDLNISQLYEILYLRSKVFVVEQSDIYLDPDYNDQKAIHILGCVEGDLVAYCRAFKTGTHLQASASIGRVLIAPKYRSNGYGKDLIAKALEFLSAEKKIQIAAQTYLLTFYESFGFVVAGEAYLEGSVEHVDMVRLNSNK